MPLGVPVIKTRVTLEKLHSCRAELFSLVHTRHSVQSDMQAEELTGLRSADNNTANTFTLLQLSSTSPNVALSLSSKTLGRALPATGACPWSVPLSSPPCSHSTDQAHKTFLRILLFWCLLLGFSSHCLPKISFRVS